MVVVAELVLDLAFLPRETLGGPDPSPRDAGLKFRQQAPLAQPVMWTMLLAKIVPDSVLCDLPPKGRKKSRAPLPAQWGFSAPVHSSTKWSPKPLRTH